MTIKISCQGQGFWRLSQEYLSGHFRHGLDCSGNRGRDLSLQPLENRPVLGQRLAGADRITLPLEHVAPDLMGDDPQQVDYIHRMSLPRQLGLSDHRGRSNRLPIMDEDLPRDRQDPPLPDYGLW